MKNVIIKSLIVALGLLSLVQVAQSVDCPALVMADQKTTKWLCHSKGGIFTAGTPNVCAVGTDATCGTEGFGTLNTCTATAGSKDSPCTAATSCTGGKLLLAGGAAIPTATLTGASSVASILGQCITVTECNTEWGRVDSGSSTCIKADAAEKCFKIGLDFHADNCKDAGQGANAAAQQSLANCFKVDMDWSGTKCIAKGTGTGVNTLTKDNCLKAELNWNTASKCVDPASGTKPLKTDCWKVGMDLDDGNNKCIAAANTANGKPESYDCIVLGMAFTSTGANKCLTADATECVKYGKKWSFASSKCTPDDDLACLAYGLTKSGTNCAYVAGTDAANCPIASTDFFTHASSTASCVPSATAAKAQQACIQMRLKSNGASKLCTRPTTSADCINTDLFTFDSTNYICKPKNAMTCAQYGMYLDGDICKAPYDTATCEKINANFEWHANDYCVFKTGVTTMDAICRSLGYKKETTPDRCSVPANGDCTGDWQKTSESTTYPSLTLCFPAKKISCQNLVLKYTNTKTLCSLITTEADCKAAGLYASYTYPYAIWCSTKKTYDNCAIPTTGSQCNEAVSGYMRDAAVSDAYKCIAKADCTKYYNGNDCISDCNAASNTLVNPTATKTECVSCNTGCACKAQDKKAECNSCNLATYFFKTADSTCTKTSVANCITVGSAVNKCTACASGYVLVASTTTDGADSCKKCEVINCQTCVADEAAKYCTSCGSLTAIKATDDDTKTGECQCEITTENLALRKEIEDATSPKIPNMADFTSFEKFYCQILSLMVTALPTDYKYTCNTADKWLDATKDKAIMKQVMERIAYLLDKKEGDFLDTNNNAIALLDKFLQTPMAMNGIMDATLIKQAFGIINGANIYVKEVSEYVRVLNSLLDTIKTSTTFTAYNTEMLKSFEIINFAMLSKSVDKLSANATEPQTFFESTRYTAAVPESTVAGIEIPKDIVFFELKEDAAKNKLPIVISRMTSNKRLNDPTVADNIVQKSNRQFNYAFAENIVDATTNKTSQKARKVTLTEGCATINLDLAAKMTLNKTSNAFYIAAYTESKWDVSPVSTQSNTDNQKFKGCVKTFDNPFIIIERSKLSNSKILAAAFMMVLSVILF